MKKVPPNFNKTAPIYDGKAHVQKASADHLVGLIPDDFLLKSDKILDVGTGTGFVAEALSRRIPNAHFTLNDIAPKMLTVAQKKLGHLPSITIYEGDGETAQFSDSPYDLIASNLTVQWFEDWRQGLQNLMNQTHVLAFSTLMAGTFQEWQAAHDALGLVSGLHCYPSFETLRDYSQSLTWHTPVIDRKTYTVVFEDSHDFIRYLKILGANTPRPGYRSSALRQVLQSLQEPFQVSYEVFYGVVCQGSA